MFALTLYLFAFTQKRMVATIDHKRLGRLEGFISCIGCIYEPGEARFKENRTGAWISVHPDSIRTVIINKVVYRSYPFIIDSYVERRTERRFLREVHNGWPFSLLATEISDYPYFFYQDKARNKLGTWRAGFVETKYSQYNLIGMYSDQIKELAKLEGITVPNEILSDNPYSELHLLRITKILNRDSSWLDPSPQKVQDSIERGISL